MQAVRSGNGFRLQGDKAFVIDGHTADLLIVAARTAGTAGERDGLTLFLVDPKTKGIETERTAMVDAHNAARIKFDNVEVDADGVLGEVDQGYQLLEGVLNIGRGAVASEMVGLSEEVFGRTVGYLKERKQFGKAIGELPAPRCSRRCRRSMRVSRMPVRRWRLRRRAPVRPRRWRFRKACKCTAAWA